MHRGERIVRHFRTGRGNGTDERALAGIRQAKQADVGQNAQFEAEIALLARLTLGALPRRPVGARLEMDVAKAALAALGDLHSLAVMRQIGDDLLGVYVGDHRPDRNAHNDILAPPAVAAGRRAILATLGNELAGITVFDQRVDVAIGDHLHAATTSAITAIRTAFRLVFLPPERDDAIAAVAGGDVNLRLVDEFH